MFKQGSSSLATLVKNEDCWPDFFGLKWILKIQISRHFVLCHVYFVCTYRPLRTTCIRRCVSSSSTELNKEKSRSVLAWLIITFLLSGPDWPAGPAVAADVEDDDTEEDILLRLGEAWGGSMLLCMQLTSSTGVMSTQSSRDRVGRLAKALLGL